MACNEKRIFSTSEIPKRYNVWSCQEAPNYPLDNILY